MRDNLSDLEDTLRKLKCQLSNVTLENKNLQMVVDTEAALKEAKAVAEQQAAGTVNADLKHQVNRIEVDITEEQKKKTEAQRILDELNALHEQVKTDLAAEVEKEEANKKGLQSQLEEVRTQVTEQTKEN